MLRLIAQRLRLRGPVVWGWRVLLAALVVTPDASAQRQMENLGRGLVAVPDGDSVYLSWRMLGTDPSDVGFDVFRTGRGGPRKLNTEPITSSTNFVDRTTSLSQENSYFVAPSIGETPLKPSATVTVAANHPGFTEQAHFRIPLAPLADHVVAGAWVGDLDGNGEYDYVVDRQPLVADATQKLEAYSASGEFLWRVDMGPGSLNRNNIEGGPSTINIGHHDGVTVYDMDGDGRSEVLVKSYAGVTFGDGALFEPSGRSSTRQFVSVLNGATGAELDSELVPSDYIDDGPVTGHFGIGYLDGERPSLLYSAQNRIGNGGFNRMVMAYDYRDGDMSLRWQWKPTTGVAKFHQIRVGDVDRDGRDELLDGGFALDDDGTLLYAIPGIVHGDRFHVGDLNPNRPGLEGYGVQQDHPDGMVEYYYDAATGDVLRTHSVGGVVDNGRGIAADVDPNHDGYEYWSFYGMHDSPTGGDLAPGADLPWPNFRIWWDGDLLSENLNETKVEKWIAGDQATWRLMTGYREGATEAARGAPLFYGDILGDWREEIVYESWDRQSLIVFTTTDETDERIYTLAHNPLYRNDMTTRGYYQSHMLDYFLGHGMETPDAPDIFVLPLLAGDADGDGALGAGDLAAIVEHLGNEGPAGGSLLGDANGDGLVDEVDTALVRLLLTGTPLAGDFNRDGVVDAADYVVWRDTSGQTGVELFTGADGDGDGAVTADDLALWSLNYGRRIDALATATPEPTSAAIAIGAVSLWVTRRAKR